MTSVQSAISRFRRDLTIGAAVRGSLIFGAIFCLLGGPAGVFSTSALHGTVVLIAICFTWFVLGYRSIQSSRIAADSPLLIATGQLDEAEKRIDAALKGFSLFKANKLLSLHHFAMLRHAQRRWQESALLCGALLRQRMGAMGGLSRPASLLLADNLLHMGDLPGTYAALGRLYQQRLNLAEALTLQQLQLEYLSRVGAFDAMLAGLKSKVQLAELMPSSLSARTHAFLALAALKTGRIKLSDWLRKRAALLCEVQTLLTERPALAELWPNPAEASGGR